jgi:hypothetical protein
MPDDHAYVSTACIHELHDRCRLTCKFCEAICRCPCHGAIPDPAELSAAVPIEEEVLS